MNKWCTARKLQVFSIAASLLIPVVVQAQNDIPIELEFQQVLPTINPIMLDGDISDEEWGHANVVENPIFFIPKDSGRAGTPVIFEEHNGGEWEGEEDQSTFTRFLYDAENLYISYLVVDDFHENGANDPWNGDAAQIMIANSDRDAQVGLYNFALGGREDDGNFLPVCGQEGLDPCIVQHEAGPSSVDEINVAITRVDGATSYEIMLSAAALGIEETLEPGTEVGFGVAINDGDQEGGQEGQKGWGGLGAHALVFGKSPSQTALLIFDVDSTPMFEGDVNMDGQVDVTDLNIIGLNWRMMGKTKAEGDLTGDGNVDAADLNLMALDWQKGVPAAAAVPEPSTMMLLLTALMGCFGILRKRRIT